MGFTMQPGWRMIVTLALGAALAPASAAAQQRIVGPQADAPVMAAPLALAASAVPATHADALRRANPTRMVIGGVLGAAVGVLACNLISEAIEEAEDSTHCTAKGNLAFGIGGAALGVLVAVLTD